TGSIDPCWNPYGTDTCAGSDAARSLERAERGRAKQGWREEAATRAANAGGGGNRIRGRTVDRGRAQCLEWDRTAESAWRVRCAAAVDLPDSVTREPIQGTGIAPGVRKRAADAAGGASGSRGRGGRQRVARERLEPGGEALDRGPTSDRSREKTSGRISISFERLFRSNEDSDPARARLRQFGPRANPASRHHQRHHGGTILAGAGPNRTAIENPERRGAVVDDCWRGR